MATITRTASTFSAVEAPVVLATATNGTLRTLDLTTKAGAWLHTFIGRRGGTALTRSAWVEIRNTLNDTLIIPNRRYDALSSIATAQNTTLNGNTSIGDATIVLTSATGFAVGDIICCHSDDTNANRVEFHCVASISSNTLTLDRVQRVAKTSGDRCTSLADVQSTWLPGGDIYEIRCINNSGQSLVFRIDAEVQPGDTVT